MKKILILGIIILSIFLIYLTTIDKKVYYVSLGDEISLGMTKDGYYEKSYPLYIKEYLEKNNKLETFIDDYSKQGYRITDLINDINNNKEIEETNKTIKNVLIKADLVTLSIGTNDILSKISNEENLTKIDYKRLYKNIEEIVNDLDKLLKIIREYCKEDIILIGTNIKTENENLREIINYANEKFDEVSKKYDIEYIKTDEIIKEKIYPTIEEYKRLSEQIIDSINNNLLK
ncbi:MAG: SGNH/GDSL hydrolase family protein [Bacilli bacterium]